MKTTLLALVITLGACAVEDDLGGDAAPLDTDAEILDGIDASDSTDATIPDGADASASDPDASVFGTDAAQLVDGAPMPDAAPESDAHTDAGPWSHECHPLTQEGCGDPEIHFYSCRFVLEAFICRSLSLEDRTEGAACTAGYGHCARGLQCHEGTCRVFCDRWDYPDEQASECGAGTTCQEINDEYVPEIGFCS